MTEALTAVRRKTPAPKTYRDRKHAARRREVLDSASDAFAELGYHQTSIEEIARRVGMRPAGFYYYYESKEAALAEVCREGAEWFLESFHAIVARPEPVETLIRQGIAHHVQREKHAYIENFAHNRRLLPPQAQRRLAGFARRYREMWAALLSRGVSAGVLRPDLDCEIAGVIIIGACNEATSLIRGMTSPEIEAARARLAEFLIDGTRKPRAGQAV